MTGARGPEPGRAGFLKRRPSPFVRGLLRLPIALYWARLGWILGHRFVVVTHLGRHTGKVHRTMLEVVRYDPARAEAVVLTPWPEHADWYLNIRARPAREISIAGDRYRPVQRFLTSDETAEVVRAYTHRGRVEAVALKRLFGWAPDLAPSALAKLLEGIAGVAFRPDVSAGQAEPSERGNFSRRP